MPPEGEASTSMRECGMSGGWVLRRARERRADVERDTRGSRMELVSGEAARWRWRHRERARETRLCGVRGTRHGSRRWQEMQQVR